ncbi:MAG: hypothetical protein Kow0029_16220 [Candidatus Rifleibacteriota bacterium]
MPDESSPDTLSKELRSLHAFERDLAIEKLTREPSKLDAFIELGELRLSQGKLQEAQRFYEMALEIDPKNAIANQGLVMVHYRKGEFDLARERMENLHSFSTIADGLKPELRDYQSRLKYQAQLGLTVMEDNRGFSETVSSIGARFPSFSIRKLTGRYRFENWNYKDNGDKVSTQVLSSIFDYQVDKNTSLSLGYAPELYSGKDGIGGYSGQFITGTDNLHISILANRQTFKENLLTVRNQLAETSQSISLYGNIHPRTKAIQTITATDLSDGNFRRRYDAEILHYIYRQGAPFLSIDLKVYQMTYDKQLDANGNQLYYWAPSDFKGGQLTLSWERSIGSRWWWGVDTNLVSNSYNFNNPDQIQDTGLGALLHLSYNYDSGRLYASIGDQIHNYFRERKLEIYGSFDF